MTDANMQLVDWLDDLCVRFIVNLPQEELLSVERICFQIEEAQWYYEDFIRPLDPSLPSMNLRRFSLAMFQHCPLSAEYSEHHHVQAYENFMAYKTRVPVRGAIMLNDSMTHAVLVKGWRKGAKWSFPRGKINKDEPDLDCAIREVYEETGYDLKEAGLVSSEEKMKKIVISMREQEMALYVIRGVPMNTAFEPRTRKEISKIDWYKLTDLPTIKKNKNYAQQGSGQDLIKENNFYMVAPFLGPLKGWIKQQLRQDRQLAKAKGGALLVPPIATGITDTEEVEVDLGETTADEAPILYSQPADGDFADLVARLGRSHRSSDALPEVSEQSQDQQTLDPAEELKRLLSVGTGFSMSNESNAGASAHGYGLQGNPLLAMLQGNKPSGTQFKASNEHYIPQPPQPQISHSQSHPRPLHTEHMPPPPPFPYHPPHDPPFRSPQLPQLPLQHFNGPQHQSMPPFHHTPQFAPNIPDIQQAFSHQVPRPYQQTGDPQFARPSQYPGANGPAIPPPSRLPPPKLNAHKLGLLNAFRAQEKPMHEAPPPPSQPVQSSQITPRMQEPPRFHDDHDSSQFAQSVSSENPHVASLPFRSPSPSANFEPVQPKPRNAHQDKLLNLFRSPSFTAATPPPLPKARGDPVELSALPTTPGHARLKSASQIRPPQLDLNTKPDLSEALSQQHNKAGTTSATVSGPVNVPDFETMKKSTQLGDVNGHTHSRGPSPAQRKSAERNRKSVEPKMFIPQQILRRDKTSPTGTVTASETASPKTASSVTTPQATSFKPQILRRPQPNGSPVPGPGIVPPANVSLAAFSGQPSLSSGPTESARLQAVGPAPTMQTGFDRRETLATDQKNALLSLFGKPSQPASLPMHGLSSPLLPQGHPNAPAVIPSRPSKSPLPRSPVAAARSSQPPTPKTLMSGVISPVSPLPDKGSQQNSPANLASRSRISSIGDSIPPGIIIPKDPIPTSQPVTAIQKNGHASGEEKGMSAGPRGPSIKLGSMDKSKSPVTSDGKSPVDKTFLLGFLEDVARRGR